MSERETHFTSLDGALAGLMHQLESRVEGVNPLPGHPGRGFDLLRDGRSRLHVKHVEGQSRAEREEEVWTRALAEYRKGERICESPIERDLLAALLTADWSYFYTENAVVHDEKNFNETFPEAHVVIVPQMHVARYRLDFGLVLQRGDVRRILALECDGKGFHDLSRDLDRDVYLFSYGIQTIRRTGSEIYRTPIGGVSDIVAGIAHWWEAHA